MHYKVTILKENRFYIQVTARNYAEVEYIQDRYLEEFGYSLEVTPDIYSYIKGV